MGEAGGTCPTKKPNNVKGPLFSKDPFFGEEYFGVSYRFNREKGHTWTL